jgi:hypothetical protein
MGRTVDIARKRSFSKFFDTGPQRTRGRTKSTLGIIANATATRVTSHGIRADS